MDRTFAVRDGRTTERGAKRVKSLGRIAFTVVLLVGVWGTNSGAVARKEPCPRGMARGGKDCEYINLCPDGRPPRKVHPTGEPTCRRIIDAPPPPKRRCEHQTVFAKGAGAKRTIGQLEGRRILVVNGPVDALIERYVKHAEKSGVRIDWKISEVIYVRSNHLVTLKVQPGLMKQIVGVDPVMATLEAASRVVSHQLSGAELVASLRKYDVICGGSP